MINIKKACFHKSMRVHADELDIATVDNIKNILETSRCEHLFCNSVPATTLGMAASCDDVAVERLPFTEINVSKDVTVLCAVPLCRDEIHATLVLHFDPSFRFVERHTRTLSNKIHGV